MCVGDKTQFFFERELLFSQIDFTWAVHWAPDVKDKFVENLGKLRLLYKPFIIMILSLAYTRHE